MSAIERNSATAMNNTKNIIYLLDTFSSSGTFCSQSEVDIALRSLQAFCWTAHGSWSAAPIWRHSSGHCADTGSIHPRRQRHGKHTPLESKEIKNTESYCKSKLHYQSLLTLQNMSYSWSDEVCNIDIVIELKWLLIICTSLSLFSPCWLAFNLSEFLCLLD